MKHVQAVLIALGSTLVASALILGEYRALAVFGPLALFGLFYVVLSECVTRLLLPKRPVGATRLINLEWVGWVGLGSLLGGVPLWLAARLPEDASGSEETSLTVIAVVAGLALIEVLKKLAIDDEIIETAAERQWKTKFRQAFDPLLANRTIPSERQLAGGVTTKSFAWQAIHLPPVHGGYGRSGRRKRAKDLATAVQAADLT